MGGRHRPARVLPPAAQCRPAPTRAGEGCHCGRKSSRDSGELYSYGPRCTVGIVAPQLRWGGGDGADHSRVFECQGFAGAVAPRNRDQKKLMKNGIWERPSPIAPMVMMMLQCCW